MPDYSLCGLGSAQGPTIPVSLPSGCVSGFLWIGTLGGKQPSDGLMMSPWDGKIFWKV
jgi:hypothetical protein